MKRSRSRSSEVAEETPPPQRGRNHKRGLEEQTVQKEAGNENMNESKLQGGFGPRAVSLSIPGRKEAVRTRLAFVVVVGSKLGSAQAA